jgi:hypothetical protein
MDWIWFSIGVIVGYIMTALMVVASREDRMNERRDERILPAVPEGTSGMGEGEQNLPGLQDER